MNWVALFSATAWVDFVVIVLSKVFPMTKSLGEWYRNFGLAAIGSDVMIIVLGIALVQLMVPGIQGWNLVAAAVGVQVVHDVLFYIGVIRGVPEGQNKVIDLFKRYAAEGSWKIILADSAMVASSVLLMEYLDNNFSDNWVAFSGVLAAYSLIYILYTK